LIRQSLLIVFIRVSALVIVFLFNVILGRVFGPEGVGHYYLFVSVVTGLSVIGRLGADLSAIRYIGEIREPDPRSAQKAVWLETLALVGLVSLSISLVWHFGVGEKTVAALGISGTEHLIAIALIPLVILIINSAVLRGMKRAVMAAVPEILLLPTANLAFLIIIVVLGYREIDLVLTNYVAASILLALLTTLWFIRHFLNCKSVPPKISLQKIRSSNLPLLSVAMLTYIINWSGIWLIGTLSDASNAGLYGISWRLVTICGFVAVAANNVNAPYFAEYFNKGDTNRLRQRVRAATQLLYVTAVPLLVGVIVFAEPLLKIFGEGFVEGTGSLRLLALGQIVSAMCGPVGYVLIMAGHESLYNRIVFVSAITTVGLSAALIPERGAEGAAIGFACGLALRSIWTWLMVRSRLRVTATPFVKRRH
jgi:O-antigen/teichoic acid export membrane protein